MPLCLGLEGLHLAVVSKLQAPNPPRPEAGGRCFLTPALGEHKKPPDHTHTPAEALLHVRLCSSPGCCTAGPGCAPPPPPGHTQPPPRGSLCPHMCLLPPTTLPWLVAGLLPGVLLWLHGESPTLLLSRLEACIPDLASILPVQESRGVRAGPPGLVKGPPGCPGGPSSPHHHAAGVKGRWTHLGLLLGLGETRKLAN